MIRRALVPALALLLTLLRPPAAEPVGPLVGTNCVDSWNAVTTNSDGTPITGGPLTYQIFAEPGTPATPSTPFKLSTPGLSVPGCVGLPAGQNTAWIAALGSALSALSAPFPFMLMIPTTPTGCVVANSAFTCAPVTTYTDGSVMPNPVSYENWFMVGTAPPSGVPIISSGPVLPVPSTLGSGAYTAYRRTLTTPTIGGSTSESAPSTGAPFAISIPATPTGFGMK